MRFWWHRLPPRLAAVTLAALLLWMGGALAILPGLLHSSSGDRFDLVRWEVSRLPRKYLHAAGAWLRDERTPDREAVLSYFDQVRSGAMLTSRGEPAEQARARAEAALEAAIARQVRAAGLATPLPFRLPASVVWPPVDVSFDDTPLVLIVARRDRIELVRTELLQPGLTAAAIDRIEAEATNDHLVALVEPLGGFAAYPAVVSVREGPRGAAVIAMHEWVHHYLAFYPLGAAYGSSPAMTSINETVADMVSHELATGIVAALDLPPEPPSPPVRVNVWRVLRELRIEVDALLARGDIATAEARMEAARLELAAAGLHYRRINQAFLAFRNVYAASPGARNPIGPALQRLRRASPSLAVFVQTVRGFDRPADLDAALGLAEGEVTGAR